MIRWPEIGSSNACSRTITQRKRACVSLVCGLKWDEVSSILLCGGRCEDDEDETKQRGCNNWAKLEMWVVKIKVTQHIGRSWEVGEHFITLLLNPLLPPLESKA